MCRIWSNMERAQVILNQKFQDYFKSDHQSIIVFSIQARHMDKVLHLRYRRQNYPLQHDFVTFQGL